MTAGFRSPVLLIFHPLVDMSLCPKEAGLRLHLMCISPRVHVARKNLAIGDYCSEPSSGRNLPSTLFPGAGYAASWRSRLSQINIITKA